MPINASDFLKAIGLGGKKKAAATKGTSGRAPQGPASFVPPPVTPINNVNLGTAGDPRMAGGPPPMAAGPPGAGGMSGEEWLSMALSALGGGPDRAAYVAPFDAAEQRARAANAQALPAIAQTYGQMRSELGTDQAVVDRDAGQARQQMAAVQAALQSQIQQYAAPVLADLASQGNTPALGGLLGAAQAQVGTGQAALAANAATQQQLSGNMQAATTASYQSRLADSQLAEGAATSSANNTLNQVLAQLDQRKAQALQQYAADAQQYGSSVARTKLEAAERAEKQNDPMAQLDLEMRRMDVEDRKADLDARKTAPVDTAAARGEWEKWHDELSRTNPVSYDVLYDVMGGNDTYAEAIADLNKRIANKEVKTKGGKQLDATFLRDRLREAYDIYDRMTEAEELEAERKKR